MTLERRSWVIARVTLILLLLVSVRLVYWQLVRGDDLRPVAIDLVQAAGEYEDRQADETQDTESAVQFLTGVSTVKELESLPQPVIQRTIDLLKTISRGAIYDRNGRVLAHDLPSADGTVSRFYTEPSLAHTIGYVSGMRTGVAGLERSYNPTLLGLDRASTQIEQMLNKPIVGSDLILTIDSFVQRAAEDALEGRSGAILVLDAKSGAILASASAPRFDPNRVLDPMYVDGLMNACSESADCQAPLLNRVSQALYPPGSTWKTVTLIAALDSGQVTPETVFEFGEPVQGPDGPYYVYQVDGYDIVDPNHAENRLNLEMSYAKSANAAFAQMGDEMLPDTLLNYASRFGFASPGEISFPLAVEYTPSQIAQDPRELYENDLLRAVTAIGQGEVLTSPMNMAMIVLSVLNDGEMPVPYLVESVREPGREVIRDLSNRNVIPGLMQLQTAQQVRQMMISVVEKGSGIHAAIPGFVVGGKTGTAQVGGDLPPHSWFAGFAESDTRSVVVVVLIENGGEGSQTAAPIFAEIAQAAISHMGEPVGEIVPVPTVQAPPATPEVGRGTELLLPSSTPDAATAPTTVPSTEQPTEALLISPTPAVSEPQAPEGLLTPEITRDPSKKDITAANPSCADVRDMPQATGEFIWPSQYEALSGGNFREGHPGFDLAAPPGSPVHAADTGLVVFAGWSGLGYGNTVLIDHGNGFRTLYAHLSQVSTNCGARVEKGKIIGLSGSTGNSTGPHLHFEVRVPGGYINPIRVLPVP
jgi:penicillin-binding protein A